ncbi:MAG: very short patch repair endonuclease [Spirochaetes bacterium]|nr:very short patch repair endonuclease [Spirochaetota bacterium]
MDNISKEARRKNMQNIRSKNTAPELKIMRELKKRRIYFSKHVKKIIGKPDIVFRKKKVIIFIDSDFWHYNPEKFIMPKSNVEYWENKIYRNKKRDAFVNEELLQIGWKVIRIWESEIKSDFDNVINRILKAIE